jgi:hypothetical protein
MLAVAVVASTTYLVPLLALVELVGAVMVAVLEELEVLEQPIEAVVVVAAHYLILAHKVAAAEGLE